MSQGGALLCGLCSLFALHAPGLAAGIDSNWANLGQPNSIQGITFAADLGFYAYGIDSIGNVPVNKLAQQTLHGWKTFPSKVAWTSVNAVSLDRKGELFAAGYCNVLEPAGAGCLGVWKGADWRFVALSPGGRVAKMIQDKEGNLYVGGAFSSIGGVAARSVAKWDGAEWSALGSGADSGVFQMAFDKAGATLYVASRSDGVRSQTLKVARWNGAWTVHATRAVQTILATAFGPDGEVFLSGEPGSAVFPLVMERYSQGVWTSLRGGLEMQEVAQSLGVDSQGVLWVTGTFRTGSGSNLSVCHGASWDGTSWKKCDFPGDADSVSFTSSGTLVATGGSAAYTRTDSIWRRLATPVLVSGVEAVALDRAGNAYLAQDSLVLFWNGLAPMQVGSGLPGHIQFLEVARNGDVYAAGRIGLSDGLGYVQRWDGKTWIPAPKLSGAVTAMAIDGKDKVHIINPIWVQRWDDTSWTRLGTSYNYSRRTGIAFDADGVLYKTDKGSVYVRNDTGWVVPEFWKPSGGKDFQAEDVFFGPRGDAYVVVSGQTDIPSNTGGFTILHWDGQALGKIGGFVPNEYSGKFLSHAFDSKGNLYVTGEFDAVYAPSQPVQRIQSIARWDGSAWTPLGMGIEKRYYFYTIKKVAIDSNDIVHVVGEFEKTGGIFNRSYGIYDAGSALTHLPVLRLPEFRPARKPSVSGFRGTLRLQDVLPQDRIQVFGLDGARLYESSGKEKLNVSSLSAHPLIVRVTRGNAVVYSGMVLP
jgi:trimeric autotransporter adhesin